MYPLRIPYVLINSVLYFLFPLDAAHFHRLDYVCILLHTPIFITPGNSNAGYKALEAYTTQLNSLLERLYRLCQGFT